jgi:hypothetical protein
VSALVTTPDRHVPTQQNLRISILSRQWHPGGDQSCSKRRRLLSQCIGSLSASNAAVGGLPSR